ncbi:MAG: hypothetical protein EOS34_19845 [Mesorhizobium sp.]|nr:MAG: hypothetical protein EOS34_19845 [Mesorhizobium sp.]
MAARPAKRTGSGFPHRSCRNGASDAQSGCVLPVLYLCSVSTGDFQDALAALLGTASLSPSVITRLTAQWNAEYDRWQKRDLSARHYVYVWGGRGLSAGADGRPCRAATP